MSNSAHDHRTSGKRQPRTKRQPSMAPNLISFLEARGINRWGRGCFTLFHTSHPQLVAALRARRGWLHTSAGLFGGNKARSAASLSRGGHSGSGFGGHLRAVHGFKFIGKGDL